MNIESGLEGDGPALPGRPAVYLQSGLVACLNCLGEGGRLTTLRCLNLSRSTPAFCGHISELFLAPSSSAVLCSRVIYVVLWQSNKSVSTQSTNNSTEILNGTWVSTTWAGSSRAFLFAVITLQSAHEITTA